ncbi:hypothetical protein D3C75_1000280 [compost metagenome]
MVSDLQQTFDQRIYRLFRSLGSTLAGRLVPLGFFLSKKYIGQPQGETVHQHNLRAGFIGCFVQCAQCFGQCQRLLQRIPKNILVQLTFCAVKGDPLLHLLIESLACGNIIAGFA